MFMSWQFLTFTNTHFIQKYTIIYKNLILLFFLPLPLIVTLPSYQLKTGTHLLPFYSLLPDWRLTRWHLVRETRHSDITATPLCDWSAVWRWDSRRGLNFVCFEHLNISEIFLQPLLWRKTRCFLQQETDWPSWHQQGQRSEWSDESATHSKTQCGDLTPGTSLDCSVGPSQSEGTQLDWFQMFTGDCN